MMELNEEAIARAARRRAEAAQLTLGATLVFVAVVVGPLVHTLVTRGLYLLELGTTFPSPWQANTLSAARWFGLLPLPFSISFAVGMCCLTGLPAWDRSIAKTWLGAARLLGIAYALVTSLTVFANLDGAFAEYDVLAPIRYHLDHVAEMVSILVAVQHLRARGARRAALACEGLTLALLLNAAWMLLAEIKLPPRMHFVLTGFRASLAVGCWVALWLGKLVALWQLRRVIQRSGNDGLSAPPEAAREQRRTWLFPASVPLRYALLVGGLSVVLSAAAGVLGTRAVLAPPAAPAPSAPTAPAASDPCVPCEPSRSTRVTL